MNHQLHGSGNVKCQEEGDDWLMWHLTTLVLGNDPQEGCSVPRVMCSQRIQRQTAEMSAKNQHQPGEACDRIEQRVGI